MLSVRMRRKRRKGKRKRRRSPRKQNDDKEDGNGLRKALFLIDQAVVYFLLKASG